MEGFSRGAGQLKQESRPPNSAQVEVQLRVRVVVKLLLKGYESRFLAPLCILIFRLPNARVRGCLLP